MRFIGDTHGKFDKYARIAQAADASIQVGDFGAGFNIVQGHDLEWMPNLGANHRFIRGNHDNPALCAQNPCWIKDGTVDGRMFFLGGGRSDDRMQRIEGRDWWPDEELSYDAFYSALDAYEASDADIVVSHECPSDVAPLIFEKCKMRMNNPSKTSQFLSSVNYVRKPSIWIHGHWHIPVDEVIDGTRFICLGELEYIDLDV